MRAWKNSLKNLDGAETRIREARARAGLTQQQVATHLDVTVGSIQAWEYGRAQLTLRRAAQLAELYGCTIDWIAFGGIPTREDPRIRQIRNLLG
jgi:transcriptional regulator with XRE-family HTH domain